MGEREELLEGLFGEEVLFVLFEGLEFFRQPDFILNSGELVQFISRPVT